MLDTPNYNNARIAKCVPRTNTVTVNRFDNGLWAVTCGLEVHITINPKANKFYSLVQRSDVDTSLHELWGEFHA